MNWKHTNWKRLHRLALYSLVITLAACNIYAEQDSKRCESLGFPRGSEQYSNCLRDQDQKHDNTKAVIREMAPSAY